MDSAKELKSLRLGTEPVGKLIFKMSTPTMISMLVQGLYNIVDSIFVSNYSQAGLTALSYAYPMQMLVLAVALGVGVGVNSLISRRLGEKNYDQATLAAQTGVFIALCSGVLFAVCGYFISQGFISLYATGEVYEMGVDYLSICICCSMFPCVEISMNRAIQATGNTIVPMISQLLGAATNIIFDPLLIFGIGFPRMGVTGAAIATVAGQAVAMCTVIVAIVVLRHKLDIRIFFDRTFRLRGKTVKELLTVGLPAFFLNAIGSIMYLVMNFILIPFTEVAVNVFGIFYKLQSIVFMPIFGLNQGIMPIFGYNYGAGHKDRFMRTLRISMITAFIMMVIGTIIFHTLPVYILKLFAVDEATMAMGERALRIASLCFLPAAIGVIMIAMFNAIGHGTKAMLISLLRQLGLLLPFAYLLSRYIGVLGIWASFPIAEVLVVIVFLPVMFATIKKIFKAKDAEKAAREENLAANDGLCAECAVSDTTADTPFGEDYPTSALSELSRRTEEFLADTASDDDEHNREARGADGSQTDR